MNVEIRHEGSDITSSVINYEREQGICSGVANLRLVRVENGRSFSTWDEVTLYEEGTKKGEFFVKSVSMSHTDEMLIELQDASKKLMDYFIGENISFPYVTAARYWIERFFNEAGVDYEFTTSQSGAPIAPDAPFGYAIAYDLIVQMLQMSNWYFYIDANGKAIVGSLVVNSGHPSETFHDTEILSIQTNTNDKMLRNRAVVWGGADIINGTWVFADITVQTRWNYDAADQRAVVLSNNYIQTYTDAYRLASQMLNEFNRITEEKTVIVEGEVDVEIGDYVFIQSAFFHGGGLVTGVASSVSESGFITTIILDQRCPRLFGFYSHFDDYVYIGTYLDGVWRKMFSGSTWDNYSTGITDLGITDLSINNGVFAATTNSGLAYYRYITGGSWINFSPNGSYYPAPSGMAEVFPSGLALTSGIYASCCTVDRMNNSIYYGYTTNSGVLSSGYLMSGLVQYTSGYSWVVGLASNGSFLRSDLITWSGLQPGSAVTIVDMDNNGVENMLVCQVTTPFEMVPTGVLFNQGYYKNNLVTSEYPRITDNYSRELDSHVMSIGPEIPQSGIPDDVEVINLGYQASIYDSGFCVYGEERLAYFKLRPSQYQLHEVHMNELGTAFVDETWNIDLSAYYNDGWKAGPIFGEGGQTYILGIYKDVVDTARYFKSLILNKNGSVSEQGSLGYLPYTGADRRSAILGEMVVQFNSVGYLYQDEDGDDHRAIIWYRGAYNYRTGAFLEWDFYYDDKNLPEYRYGADIDHSNAPIFVQSLEGSPIFCLLGIETVERTFVAPCTVTVEQQIFCLTIYSNMTTNFEFITPTYQFTYIPCIVGWEEDSRAEWITGYNLNKTIALWKYKVSWHVGGGDPSTIIVNLALPNTEPVGYEFPPVTVEMPLSSRSGDSFVHLSSEAIANDHAYLYEHDQFVCELNIPVDDFFPDPSDGYYYSFYPTGFCGNIDANDDTIYGVVVRSNNPLSKTYGQGFNCGWNREGTLTKRWYGNTINATNHSSRLTMFNQFAISTYGSNTDPNHKLFTRFAEPSDRYYLWASQITVVRQDTDRSQFTPIHVSTYPIHVDTSKNAPTLINTYQATSGEWSTQGYMGVSWTNLAGEFNTIFTDFPIADARTFDVGNPSGFVVESGIVSISGFRYIAFVNSGGMFFMDATLYDPAITTIATASGMTTASGVMSGIANPSGLFRLEITNYSTSTPYFFGATPHGFWQRDPGMSYFTDYSVGLPSSEITIIRADDRV